MYKVDVRSYHVNPHLLPPPSRNRYVIHSGIPQLLRSVKAARRGMIRSDDRLLVTIGTRTTKQGEIGYEANISSFSTHCSASAAMGAAVSRKVGADGAFDSCELQLSSPDETLQQCSLKYGCSWN